MTRLQLVVGCGLAIFAIILTLFVGLALGLRTDQWHPVGDGKTIVNTRTGETRIASTGESVAAFSNRLAREKQLEKENRDKRAVELQLTEELSRKSHQEQEAA